MFQVTNGGPFRKEFGVRYNLKMNPFVIRVEDPTYCGGSPNRKGAFLHYYFSGRAILKNLTSRQFPELQICRFPCSETESFGWRINTHKDYVGLIDIRVHVGAEKEVFPEDFRKLMRRIFGPWAGGR